MQIRLFYCKILIKPFCYLNFVITNEMIAQRSYGDYRSYRMIDFEGTSITGVKYIVLDGKKYYDSTGNGVTTCDFNTDTTLYAVWKRNS